MVVLPEHIGTWLVAVGEKRKVFAARDLAEARIWLGLSHPLELLRALFANQGTARFSDALLRMKARQMADDYQSLFGGLAEDLRREHSRRLHRAARPAWSTACCRSVMARCTTSAWCSAATACRSASRSARYCRTARDSFTAAASDQALQVVTTPAGRLGVLIGTDNWRARLCAADRQQVELLAVPAYLPGNGHWNEVWSSTPATCAAAPIHSAKARPGCITRCPCSWRRVARVPAWRFSCAASCGTSAATGAAWR